jgi:hypothetical protein
MKTVCWLFSTLTVLLVTGVAGREHSEPVQTDAEALVAEFGANKWSTRASAFSKLVESPTILAPAQQKRLLTEVLERENEEVDRAFREGVGTSRKYGEGYGEYQAKLATYLLSLVEPSDVRALAALAKAPYHENSPRARSLAAYGETLFPTIVELAASDISPKRWQAVGLAGEMLRLTKLKQMLTPATQTSIVRLKEVLAAGIRDQDITIRQIAARNMGIAADAEFLPLLEVLAETDAGVTTYGGKLEYPVRDEARKALARITAK